ncbi:Cellobiose dehydrogenase cytochrome domain-containing protein [Madurella fahalii]|uniref:Cellobiose dehydrogenase cytochrome domain-containing protein n=1 Tax=Madurella fahalii TaxID=1157608 RepID=A0ABQ0G7R9_9PEZI
MGLLQVATTVLVLGNAALGNPVPQGGTGSAAAKYCDPATTICYSEYTSPEGISYRIAIPDTATAGSFDILVQIVAPRTVGWAGIAWGGVMVNNPLLVGWANGETTVASSRRASARTYPTPYTGATYTVLPGSTANSTHWTLNVLAKGVSSWGNTNLDPSSTAVPFAYAQSAAPPTEPANNASRFSIHNTRGKWSHDLSNAKLANFTELVQRASEAPES